MAGGDPGDGGGTAPVSVRDRRPAVHVPRVPAVEHQGTGCGRHEHDGQEAGFKPRSPSSGGRTQGPAHRSAGTHMGRKGRKRFYFWRWNFLSVVINKTRNKNIKNVLKIIYENLS